jgi:hypothetical protein
VDFVVNREKKLKMGLTLYDRNFDIIIGRGEEHYSVRRFPFSPAGLSDKSKVNLKTSELLVAVG